MNINASELTKIEAAAVAPNRRYLVTGHRDKQLYYLDLETKKQTRIRANPKTYATAIAVSEDSRLIATGGFHDAVRIFNAKTKKKILNIKGDTDYSVVTDLVFSADGKYLAGAFGDYDRYLQVWEVKTGKHVFFTHVETEVFNIVFSSSGKEIIGASQYGEILSVWDIATEEQVQGLGKRDNLWALNLAKNHSGSTIAVVTNRSKVIMWDIATKKEQAEISLTPSNCVSIPLICFSADDKRLQ